MEAHCFVSPLQTLELAHTLWVPAQVQNELPYLVEHIEFMRVMGVNRIVVCDDRSTDNTTALQARFLRCRAGSRRSSYIGFARMCHSAWSRPYSTHRIAFDRNHF